MFMRKRDIAAFGQKTRAARPGLALLAVLMVSTSACAGDAAPPTGPTQAVPAPDRDEGFLKNLAKKTNMATDVGEPADFVVKSRPSAPTDYVPIFGKTVDHKTKVLTPDQVKATEAELGAASAQNGKIRDAFPPARKAYIEAQEEKAQKAAAKRAKTPEPTAVQ
jgi:hypothetical protein